MAILEVLAVGSATLLGVETYQRRKGSSLVQLLQGESVRQTSLGQGATDTYGRTRSFLANIKDRVEHSLAANARPVQLSPEEESKAIRKAREARLHMRTAAQKSFPYVVAMTVASAAAIFFTIPFLNLFIGGVILYTMIPMMGLLYRDLRAGKITIEHLGTIVILVAVGQGSVFAACLNFLVLMSRYVLLGRIEDDSMNDMVDVFRQQPRTVWIISDGVEVEIPLEDVKLDDVVVVSAGSVIPVDGEIVTGVASVDQHILTGESQPVEKRPGDPVFALTTILSGRIEIAVEKAGEETAAAQIGNILNQTIDVKTNMQLWSESLAERSVIPFLIASGAVAPFIGINSATALLNTHPKYRATVTSAFTLVNYLNLTTRHGILVKDGRTLELLKSVDTVVFDKTGTLTEEQPHVGQIHVCSDLSTDEILELAAAAEERQTHPIARAIVEAAVEQALTLPQVDKAAYKVGYGLTVTIDDRQVRVGSVRFIEMEGISIPKSIVEIQASCYSQGHSLILVAVDEQVAGAVELHATVRPEAQEVIQALREQGIEAMYIISGDHEAPTRALAKSLGIENYFAETLPENKADLIDELQQQMGRSVCYVGDGINDSIALKKAHISISMRGASTVATDTANVVLMDGTLNQLPLLFELAQEYQSNMRQTFGITLLPSLIAAGGALFLHWGLVTSILLNQVGTVLGVGNAMRPRLQKLAADKWQTITEKKNNYIVEKSAIDD